MANYYVCSNTGLDTNDGSESSPFKTINFAAQKANAGDIVNVLPGIYRERIAPKNGGERDAPITYRSTTKHGAVVRGSEVWKPETNENNIAQGPIDASIFTDDSHVDGKNPFLIPMSVTPYGREGCPETRIKAIKNSDKNMVYCLGQVFVDDVMYTQCPYKTEMESTTNSWYYDLSSNQLYVNGVNENQSIEITNQRRLFAPHTRNLRNIIVDGFIFERCANQYPNKFWSRRSNQQAGAVGTRCGKFWIIQNNIIRYANCVGIDWGNEGGAKQDLENGSNGAAMGAYGTKILNNIISDNGSAGTAAYMANNFEFKNNLVERNNNLKFYGKQRWECAGVKVHRPKKSSISQNIIRDNHCHGIWSDQGAGISTAYSKNIIVNNKKSGIEFEIGTNMRAKVVNNIFDNNDNAVRFATSGGVLVSHNMFIRSKTCDIRAFFFKRPDKWDSLNLDVYYNMFCHSPQYYMLTPNSEEPKSSRTMGCNTYLKNTDKHFQIDNKKDDKPFMDYDSWKGIFNDESVICTTPSEISLECTDNKYTLNMDMGELPSFPKNNKNGINSDMLNNSWGEQCICGPISNIIVGSNKCNLNFPSSQ